MTKAKTDFTIKRKNLTAIKAKKEADAKKPKLKLKDMTPEQKKERYDRMKRKPLSKLEQDFLKDFYYKGEGSFAGRDVMYNAMKAHYAKNKTPKEQQISRRRMWEYFLSKQESNQLHRSAPKNSEVIRPINSKYKLDKGMADLIIRGGDSARKYKGILCVVDVSTRKAWTELLTATTAKAVAKAMEAILQRVKAELPASEKHLQFKTMGTDGGAEFKAEYASLLKARNIKQVVGVAHRSSSQSIVERFNGNIQASMAKEGTATGADWHTLVEKHTAMYNNNRTHRLTRLKESEEEMKKRVEETGETNKGRQKQEYKLYTPAELYKADRGTLQELHDKKANTLGKQNKDVRELEERVNIGDTVRLVDMSKRKGALAKGYKPNYTKEIYQISKIRKPKGINTNKPYQFIVKNKQTNETKKIQNRPVPYTIKDFMVIDADVQTAPDDIKVDQTPQKADTRSGTKPPAPKPKPPPKPPPKPKAPKKQDDLIDKRVKSVDAKGKLTGEGTIVRVIKKGKGGKKWEVAWDEKYNFSNGKYSKKDIDQMLM